ncbi:MAG: tocopherol cyclase family protein [Paludibacter sp.]|jgi:tocopherol cyclase
MIKKLKSIFNPNQFQGWGKTKKYFEGWYFKLVTADESRAFAFIPGIAMDENGKQQSFIQVLDGKKRTAEYHKFDVKEFFSTLGKFEIEIAENYFSINDIQLNLSSVQGKLRFSEQIPWPNQLYSPGIMGPYSFVPFMECYHGILSMNHRIDGQLTVNGETIDFTNGRGYIEKDWGHSFPSAYTWLQSNHFSKSGISLKASVAKIPWLGTSFIGFIAGIWINEQLIQFTTYNGSKLQKSYIDKEKVELIMENRKYKLDINARREKSTQLASPISGFMDGRIEESMTSEIEVKLFDKKNNILLLNDKGKNAGLEVAGNVEEILVMPKV